MRAAAASKLLNWLGSAVAYCFALYFRWAIKWLAPAMGLLAIVLAWGRWTGWIPPPRNPTWQDSPAVMLLAGLLVWGVGLFYAWFFSIEFFPELTLEQRQACHREIQHLLKENVSEEGALQALLKRDYWAAGEDREGFARRLLDWAAAHDAELWFYDTDADRWENLCGECGFALVREGRVIDSELWMLN